MSVTITHLTEGDVLVPDAGDLCEGPCWDESTRTLVWVDILAGVVNTVDPLSGHRQRHALGMPVSAVAPRVHGGWVAAVERGFLLLDAGWGAAGDVIDAPGQPVGTRFNDGHCDPEGRFWAGTLAYDGTPEASALYRLDPDGSVRKVLDRVTNSNGIGWSPDGGTMYYVDTGRGSVDRLELELLTGVVTGRSPVARIDPSDGLPDGLTVDAEGYLWLALWGGACVRRYRPDGTLEHVIRLPATQVTSVTFGGDGLGELFITTAREGLSREQRTGQPLAGSIFHWRPGVAGLPASRYAA